MRRSRSRYARASSGISYRTPLKGARPRRTVPRTARRHLPRRAERPSPRLLPGHPVPVAGDPDEHAGPGTEGPPGLGDTPDRPGIRNVRQPVVVLQVARQAWLTQGERVAHAGRAEQDQARIDRAEPGDGPQLRHRLV